jgi:hypothetical protein
VHHLFHQRTHPNATWKKLKSPQPALAHPTISKYLSTWTKELESDEDKNFLLHGLKHGFPLIDCDPSIIKKYTATNHKSCADLSQKVSNRIREEMEDGNYIETPAEAVTLVSPLAAIEKSDGDVRLIHDLSHPKCNSLNDYATKEDCQYENVADAVKDLHPEMWMAKCDLKWAYRSMPIQPEHYTLTGLQWTFPGNSKPTTLIDTAFPFGARKSPAHFNRITKAVKRMMIRRGFNCIVYLDDFLLYENSLAQCQLALLTLVRLLRSLGFRINWNKMCDPCKTLTFLGIEIDLTTGTLKLDEEKRDKLTNYVTSLTHRKRVSKQTLQALGGKLIWASNVIKYGRAHMNTIFHALRHLKEQNHKMRITTDLLDEFRWWIKQLTQQQHWRPIWPTTQQPAQHIATDASLVAGGAFSQTNGAWIYRNWLIDQPSIAHSHITIKELAMIAIAVETWGPHYPEQHFYIACDNIAAVLMTNSGATRNYLAAGLLKRIFAIALKFNLSITAYHIAGVLNEIPDSISRLHSPGQMLRLSSLLNDFYHPDCHPTYILLNNMSSLSHIFLLPRLANYYRAHDKWI